LTTYSWFARLEDTTPHGLSCLSKSLDENNYHAVMLTYHPYDPDNFIKSLNILNPNHKIKYIIAIRPYALTPEYLAMMINAFEEVCPNRLMINIVGGMGPEEENVMDNLIINKEYFDNHITRRQYTREFIKKVKEILPSGCSVEFINSASLDYDIETSNMYADANLMFYSDFIKNYSKVKTKKNIVSIMPIIRDTHEEAKEQYDSMLNKNLQQDVIYGTEQEIIDQINSLKQMGATDFLAHPHRDNPNAYRVRLLINKMISQEAALGTAF